MPRVLCSRAPFTRRARPALIAGAAVISLIAAVVLGGWGMYWSYVWRDAIEVALLPYTLLAGCGVVLLAQLIRWAIMRGIRG